jgi:hypothetical protein
MNRKSFRRRLEVESLESMTLLSGVSVTGHHAVAALVARETQSSVTIALLGTAHGTYRAGSGYGAATSFNARGKLTPIGAVTVKGSINLTAAISQGTATISTKRGKIFTSLVGQGLNSPAFYTITGGTGRLAGASGSGEAVVTIVPARNPGHGKVSITFEQLPV